MSKPIPYLNEIVGLTVLLLMVVALIAGQSHAVTQEAAQPSSVISISKTSKVATEISRRSLYPDRRLLKRIGAKL